MDTLHVNLPWEGIFEIMWWHNPVDLPWDKNITSITVIVYGDPFSSIEACDIYFDGVLVGTTPNYPNPDGSFIITVDDPDVLEKVHEADIGTGLGSIHHFEVSAFPNPYRMYVPGYIYDSVLIVKYGNDDDEVTPVKTPIPLFTIILTMVFMSSIIYYKIK